MNLFDIADTDVVGAVTTMDNIVPKTRYVIKDIQMIPVGGLRLKELKKETKL